MNEIYVYRRYCTIWCRYESHTMRTCGKSEKELMNPLMMCRSNFQKGMCLVGKPTLGTGCSFGGT